MVLTKQFRIGAFTARESDWFPNNFSPWLVEGVAGIIEGNESPEDVACRESIEETGCQIDKLDFIDDYHADTFKILTLPRSKGKDSKCPLKKLAKTCR